MNTKKTPLFELGQLVSTPGVLEEVSHEEILASLARHVRGDWGDCCKEDAEMNDLSLKDGSRIFSVYISENGTKFWIITEATCEGKRASTCVLLPSEY